MILICYITLTLIILILVYLYSNNIIENYVNNKDVMLRADKIFKKNFDLNYYDIRDPSQVKEMKKILTNQLAPIIDKDLGKKNKKVAKVDDVSSDLTNRIPDDNSNNENYTIPLPKFDDLQKNIFNPLVKTFSELQNLEIKKKNKKIKEFPTMKIVKNKKKKINDNFVNKISKKKCKFIYSDNTNKCDKDYPIHTGATFSTLGNSLTCNDQHIQVKTAKALAIIKDGSIVKVKILEHGTHYTNIPKIYVRGTGINAILKAHIENNKLSDISIINGGKNYHSTPIIVIEKPNPKIQCNLCCQ